MRKITKKEFVATICSHKSVQIGLTRHLVPVEEINNVIANIKEGVNFDMSRIRTCRGNERNLLFSNGSHLSITGESYTLYLEETTGVYIVDNHAMLEGDDREHHIYLYYYIMD